MRLVRGFFALFLVACSRREHAPPDPPPPGPAPPVPVDACPGLVRGEPLTQMCGSDPKFRLVLEGFPRYPICNTCGITVVVDPPGPTLHVSAHQDFATGTIYGYLDEEPPDGACIRVSPYVGDFDTQPVGRYRRATRR